METVQDDDDDDQPLLVQCFQEPYQCIRERTLEALDLRSLFVLARTSKTLRREIMRVWDINARLGVYFDNPIAFRDELGRRNAIITGAFAVQFFERAIWGEPNIEIMVRQGNDAEAMHRFLNQEAGYELAKIFPEWPSSAVDEDHDWHQFPECVTYSRTTRRGVNVKVRLIETEGFTLTALLQTDLSCLLNCITSTHAYSIFPDTTFLRHHMLHLRVAIEESRYSYWTGRGWESPKRYRVSYGYPDFKCYLSPAPLRQIGDRHTWTIPLDTQGLAPARDPPVLGGRTYDFGRVPFVASGKYDHRHHQFYAQIDCEVNLVFTPKSGGPRSHGHSETPTHVSEFVILALGEE